MTAGRAETALERLEAARGRRGPRAPQRLWASVPESMRLSCLAESSVAPRYAGAFGHDGTWRAGVDLSCLPEPMHQEVLWWVFRIIELGGKIPTPTLSILVRRLGEVLADRAGQGPVSLLGLSSREGCQQMQRAAHRRAGRLPAATTMRNIRQLLTRMTRLLVTAVDPDPWWHRGPGQPGRGHPHPAARARTDGPLLGAVRPDRHTVAATWHCKVGLGTGGLSYSSVHRRVVAVKELDGFPRGRGVDGPRLADHAAGVRALMLDFLGHLRARQVTRGRRGGQRLSPASVQRPASDVEQFSLFMADNTDAAATALAEPGWPRLGPAHAGFYRRGELPGKQQPRLESQIIDDDAMTQIMGGPQLLGAAVEDGGFGDEQAMRITMLVALLGRRVSEICLLDHDPLSPAVARGWAARCVGGRRHPGIARQAPLPADEDRRRSRHHPRARRGRRDHPGATTLGEGVLRRTRRARQDTEVSVPR